MKTLSKQKQAYCFWLLSSAIRRKNRRLSGEEMLRRINYDLINFNWADDILARISELQTIAYKELRREQYVVNQKDNSRFIRSASK